MNKAMRIFISDPHVIFREGIKKIVARLPGYSIAGESGNTSGLRDAIHNTMADMLFIFTMPIKTGIEAIESLVPEFPGLKMILLTNSTRHPDLYTAFSRGYAGIIYKAVSEQELMSAFEVIRNGQQYISPELLPYFQKRQQDQARGSSPHKKEETWTPREITILKCICKGYSNVEISRLLNLNCRTIEGHKSRMIEKAGVPNSLNLILFALKRELISISDL